MEEWNVPVECMAVSCIITLPLCILSDLQDGVVEFWKYGTDLNNDINYIGWGSGVLEVWN